MTICFTVVAFFANSTEERTEQKKWEQYYQEHHCVRKSYQDYGLFNSSTYACDNGEEITR